MLLVLSFGLVGAGLGAYLVLNFSGELLFLPFTNHSQYYQPETLDIVIGMVMLILILVMGAIIGGLVGFFVSLFIGVFLPQQSHKTRYDLTDLHRSVETRTTLVPISSYVGRQVMITNMPVTTSVPVLKYTYVDGNGKSVNASIDEAQVAFVNDAKGGEKFITRLSWSFKSPWMSWLGTESGDSYELHLSPDSHL